MTGNNNLTCDLWLKIWKTENIRLSNCGHMPQNRRCLKISFSFDIFVGCKQQDTLTNAPSLLKVIFEVSSCNLLQWTYFGVCIFIALLLISKFSERLMWLFDELFLTIKVILRWIIKILNKSVNETWDNQENNHQLLQLSQSYLPLHCLIFQFLIMYVDVDC